MKISFFKIFLILLAAVFVLHGVYFAIRDLTSMRIEAHFDTLRPFRGHASVYYKGFKVGRSVKIRPIDDYSHTIVDIVLYPRDLSLPKNIKVQIKKKTLLFKFQHDYFEIICPSEPDSARLATGDIIEGINSIDVKDYLASYEGKSLDEIRENIENATKNLNDMLISLGDLFQSLNETVRNSQKHLQKSACNLEIISKNMAQISTKLNNALSDEVLEGSAKNIEEITKNLNDLTSKINSQSEQIESIINNTNGILENANKLTSGLNNTLSKRFSGLRLIFGRALE